MNENVSIFSGIGTTLFIVFLVLKLTNVIDWSWWYVTMPLWGEIAILVLALIIFGVVYSIIQLFKNFKK